MTHVETRVHDRAGPNAARMEALRVILGDERVNDPSRRKEGQRRAWANRQEGEA